MPRAEWMSDYDYKKFEECLKDFKGKGNKYAICSASIKKRKESVKREALRRL
jgi:hypothetical protein